MGLAPLSRVAICLLGKEDQMVTEIEFNQKVVSDKSGD